MNTNDETKKRREQFDLVKVLLERSKSFPANKNKEKIISNYLNLPFIYRSGINKLIIRTYFRTLNINDLTIYDVISKQSNIETIIRTIECQIKYIEENNINIDEIKAEEAKNSLKMDNIDSSKIAVTTCWNCLPEKFKKKLQLSEDIIYCYSCGKYYFKGEEYTPEKNNEITRSR